MIHFGMVRPGSTLRIPFDTFSASTGAPTALSDFAVGDILIYKDGNTTARASTTGYTATTSFSSVVGINEAVIDLSSDAEADFFKSGSHYVVVLSPVTADGQTLAFVAATFSIGYPNALLNTSIATLSSQTSFTLTSGPAEDDALNGMYIVVHDKASAVQTTWAIIEDYTGSTKTVTLAATPAATFTIAAIDNVAVFGPMPLQSTVHGRKLDVSTGGEAGVDWANVGSPTTSLALTGTTIATTQKVDVETIKTNPVVNGGTITFPTGATLASTTNITAGTVTTATNVTTVNGLAANVITAASMAADASAEIADAVWDEDATGHQTQGTFGQAIGDPVADTNTIYKAVVTDAAGATVGVDVVAVKAVVDDILVDTAEIGAAGAGLTNINLPDQTMNIIGNITGNLSGSVGSVTGLTASNLDATISSRATPAQVNTEVDTALADINLDHLVKIAVDTDFATTVHLDSVIGQLADDGTTATFDRTTDSLESIRNKETDIETDTAEIGAAGAGLTNINLPNQTMDIVGNITGNLSGSVGSVAGLTPATIADQVWEEAIVDHSGTAGSTAEALAAAGSAGDPWATALPGLYSAGQAGKIVGDNLNATVGSRATQVSVDDLPTNAELATALGTADDAVLAQVALVKAQTDLIPAAPASTTNITAGTITTVTNLTNAPTNGDLTAAMKLSVNAEVDTALSDYDGPTHAELTTALGTADDAVLAAIAALNNIAAGAAMTLTTGERDAIAAAILDLANGIETGLTLRQAQRLEVAALAGKLSGAATTTVTIRNAIADSKDRIVATVDNDGNRSAITTDLT